MRRMRHPEKRTVVDANSGAPWSEMDIRDLFYELARGRTIAETASFLCRDEDELRQKAKELGLVEQPGKRRVVLYRVISKITTCKITTTATPMAVNATAPRCSSRLTQSPPAWPHSPSSSGGDFVGRADPRPFVFTSGSPSRGLK